MKIDRIVGVMILTAVAQSAAAGTFLIDDVWQTHRQSILSETKMWAGAGASAHYDGTVDWNDNKWALEANLIIDGKIEFSSTGGKGGNTISAGMVVTCSELNCGAFGNNSPQPPSAEPNGFRALAVFDRPDRGGDSDGWLTARDAIFSELLLWRDADHDGRSDPGELLPLSAAGIEAIELSYVDSRRRDRHGNQFRYKSRVRLRRSTTEAVDVFLLSQ